MIDFDVRGKEITDWLIQEYTGIRTGQSTPALLDNIKVESYGSMMPINQIGTVGVEDARTLRISLWDAGGIPAVEKALREADLGVSVAADSAGLRVIFPELTSERRVQLLKLAKNKLEEARVSVRSTRDEIMKDLDKQQKDGDIGEDDKFTQKDAVQNKVNAINTQLEGLYTQKETEISR
ncbi:MAG: ribosome recycling factor [Acidimicrobiales bacterium]|jgi:ribosome recycling factor